MVWRDCRRRQLDFGFPNHFTFKRVIQMEYILRVKSMRRPIHPAGIFKALFAVILAVQLVACGGGGGDTSSGASSGSVSASGITPVSSTTSANNTSNTATAKGASTLTLSWVAPVTRADGTPLSLAEIDGFNIYFGDSHGNYPNHVNVNDGSAQTITLENVPVGTYYIVMTTYDVNGIESRYSAVVKKTVS
jgi:hypothetical protein